MVKSSFNYLLGLSVVLLFMAGCATTEEEPVVEETPTTETPDTTGVDTTPTRPQEEEAPDLPTTFYFDFDQSVIKPEGRSALTAWASRLRNGNQNVRLEGHADERGTREYNMALGERRANAVRDFLVLQGVERSRIETVSYGEERPARLGSNDAAWAANRRVELEVQ